LVRQQNGQPAACHRASVQSLVGVPLYAAFMPQPDGPLLVGLYLTREGPSATCKRTGCGYPAPFLNNPTEDTMAWTTPTIVEFCAGFEVTAYASAE
jgi:coenzyme PQQ precursor peptide PqqA